MKPLRKTRAGISGALVFCLLAAMSLWAKNGRDFAGWYELSQISQTGKSVHLTLTLKIFNYSNADVKNAAVGLLDVHSQNLLGGFPAIKLFRNGREANVVAQFAVPLHDYEHWQKGMDPRLVILYKDASGRTVERNIQVMRHPAALPTTK